jgi:hypothetical protein
LQDNLQLDATHLKLVLIVEYVRQIGSQPLAVEKGAVGASNVLYQVG